MPEITIFNGCKDKQPLNTEADFEALEQVVRDDWLKEPWARSQKEERTAIIFGRCENTRANENIRFLSFLGGDIDTPPSDPRYIPFDDMCDALDKSGFRYIAHTTTTNSHSHNKYRLIFDYGQDVPVEKCRAAWHAVNAKLGGIFDGSTHDPARLSFAPADWFETEYEGRNGKVSIPDAFNKCRSNLNGAAILTASEINELELTALKDVRCQTSSAIRSTNPKLTAAQLEELRRGLDDKFLLSSYCADINRSSLVSKQALMIADEGLQGSRDYRFMKAVVGMAIIKELPISHALLVRLAEQFSHKFLKRLTPDNLAEQAHNALAEKYHNRPKRFDPSLTVSGINP